MTIGAMPVIARDFISIRLMDDFNLSNEKGYHDFRNHVAIQAQGEIAVLPSDWPAEASAATFAIFCDIADETLIRMPDNSLMRLFLHSKSPVSYAETFSNDVWNKIKKVKDQRTNVSDLAGARSSRQIDLISLWEQTTGDAVVSRTQDFIPLLPNAFLPAEKVILIGEIPALPLFAAIYFSRSYGKRIFYQKQADASSVPLFL
ncbi:MAG TPA: hypothetical protein VMX18_03425 [Candidatus Bipolaricaulota bacterium]|nr:hypothetical protein [Candidatus Bipolaricaulota bacterium]